MADPDLKKRLKRLESFLSIEKKDRIRDKEKSRPLPCAIPGVEGAVRTTAAGSCFCIHASLNPDTKHGSRLLGSVPDKCGVHAGEDIRGGTGSYYHLLRGYSPARAIFFDTETTGLSLGAGTVAFLVGIAFFKNGNLEVHQFLMRDYNEEKAQLEILADTLSSESDKDLLVSYNGRGFDAHLLNRRYGYHGIRSPLERFAHLDLLHPSRRIWGRRLESCSLKNLEEHLFSFARIDDIDGALIPSAYRSYLRNRNTGMLAKIAEHNKLDMVSLVILASDLRSMFAGGYSSVKHVSDAIGVARVNMSLGMWQNVESLLSSVSIEQVESLCGDEKLELLTLRSIALKKMKKLDKAIELWELMTKTGETRFSLFPYLEIAKAKEHIFKDYQGALEMVDRAVSRLEITGMTRQQGTYRVSDKTELDNLYHRKRRLLRRISNV